MLSNTITLTDVAVADHPFDLVSREGMSSVRRETGVASNLASSLIIKNTVDLSSPTKQNRHLVQLTLNEIDGTTGEVYPCSVHIVIARHKMHSDASIKDMLAELASLITVDASVSDILLGGN